jgi:polyhydroxyalkanoate synthase subunit PhaC
MPRWSPESAGAGFRLSRRAAMMTTGNDLSGSAGPEAMSAPLDLLLTDAVFGALSRLNPGESGLRLAAALASRPGLVAGRGRQLLGEMARIVVGNSQVQPSRRDRRFADPGWAGNPLLRRVMQAYLATAETAEGLAADVGLDWADQQRVNFVLSNLIDAAAPSNNPLLNPAALKAAIDTGGGSVVPACATSPPTWPARRGCRRWWSRTRSRSGWTWPLRRGRWCCARRCSS